MKRLALTGILAILLLCCACGKSAQPAELTRVVYARGNGSVWGNQFHMDVCPTEVSYLHDFRDGTEFRELFALPIEQLQWEQIRLAAEVAAAQLQVQKPPNLLQRLAPKADDGGDWWSLTLTWVTDGEPKDVTYIWAATAETEAFSLLLEELAQSLDG